MRKHLDIIGNLEIVTLMECQCSKEYSLRTKSLAWHWLPPSLAPASLPCTLPEPYGPAKQTASCLLGMTYVFPILPACSHGLPCSLLFSLFFFFNSMPSNKVLLRSHLLYKAFLTTPDSYAFFFLWTLTHSLGTDEP